MTVEHPFIEFVERLATAIELRLPSDLMGVYRIGSLAHGGFSLEYSDIDVAIIVNRELTDEEVQSLTETAKQIDPEMGKRLSLFWSNQQFDYGRMPILDRLDLIDYGVQIRGKSKLDFKRPNQSEIHEALLRHVEKYWRPKTLKYSEIQSLRNPVDKKDFVRTFLYPARFLFTWNTLKLGSNDEAVAWLLVNRSPNLNIEIICKALGCRQGMAKPTDLLTCKSLLSTQFKATFEAVGRPF